MEANKRGCTTTAPFLVPKISGPVTMKDPRTCLLTTYHAVRILVHIFVCLSLHVCMQMRVFLTRV